jgi:hypothetical protein
MRGNGSYPRDESLVGRTVREQALAKLEQGLVALAQQSGDQRAPIGKVPVEGADGDVGLARNALQ